MKVFWSLAATVLLFTTAHAMDISGNFTTETRDSLSNGDILFNEESGHLKFEGNTGDNFYAMAQVGFRYYGYPVSQTGLGQVLSPLETGEWYSLEPLEIGIDQAYFTCRNFLLDNLDFSAGKQRITWGTADKLNPTDLLDPGDFSDPLRIGEKIPVIALNVNYSIPAIDGGLQLVYEPYSGLARINGIMASQVSNLLVSNLLANDLPSVLSPSVGLNGSVQAPELNVTNGTFGARFSAKLAGFDLSASYMTRINDIPYISSVSEKGTINGMLAGMQFAPTNLVVQSVNYELSYYREHVIGFDFSKDLGFIVLWGEVAATIPPQLRTTETSANTFSLGGTALGSTNTTNLVDYLSNQPYFKYTVGFDCTIGDGYYLNFQWNHGGATESGNEGANQLQDYLVLRMEKKFFNDKLKFTLTGTYNVDNFYEAATNTNVLAYLDDHYAVMGDFAVTYSPISDLSAAIGVTGVTGKTGTMVGLLSDYNMLYTKIEYSF
jgi:hypothetical protein